LNGISDESKRRVLSTNWPTFVRPKKESNRVTEEVGDWNEMDLILIITIGSAIFLEKMAEPMPKSILKKRK